MARGIPTKYAGVQFRSRLEAKWAAMFELLGWPWEYEPIDLSGYIPDFIIEHDRCRRLIEVKPALKLTDYHEAQDKAEHSGWTGHAACVGAIMGELHDRPCFGTMRLDISGGPWTWAPWQPDISRADAVAKWREAGNLVQWRGKSSKAKSTRVPASVHAQWDDERDDDLLAAMTDAEFLAWLRRASTNPDSLTVREHRWWAAHARAADHEKPGAHCRACGGPIGSNRRGIAVSGSEWEHASGDLACREWIAKAAEDRRKIPVDEVKSFFGNLADEFD